MILVDGNPLKNLDLVVNPEKNFVLISKTEWFIKIPMENKISIEVKSKGVPSIPI
jgi:hypothetical protein